jgi:hypothetical protein
LHAVTSEPGGDAEIVERLARRGVKDLPFGVHSDPDYKLLLKKKDNPSEEAPVYTKSWMHADEIGTLSHNPELDPAGIEKSETSIPYKSYFRTEPALVVISKSGDVQQIWSWVTWDAIKDFEPKKSLTWVPGYGLLVSIRPVSSDIAMSIAQNRNVKLKGNLVGLVIENLSASLHLSGFGVDVIYAFMWVVGVLLIAVMASLLGS